MKKTYSKIICDNKDVIYYIKIDNSEPVILRYVYNSISNTYYGFKIESFLEGIKMLLKIYPNFLMDVDGTYELAQWFRLKGFIEVEVKETLKAIYQ